MAMQGPLTPDCGALLERYRLNLGHHTSRRNRAACLVCNGFGPLSRGRTSPLQPRRPPSVSRGTLLGRLLLNDVHESRNVSPHREHCSPYSRPLSRVMVRVTLVSHQKNHLEEKRARVS
jgi:hypothetical protein